jgi:hypothetical protein
MLGDFTIFPRPVPSCDPVGTPSRPTIWSFCVVPSYRTCRSMILSALEFDTAPELSLARMHLEDGWDLGRISDENIV